MRNTQSVQASCWAVDCGPSVLCIVCTASHVWQSSCSGSVMPFLNKKLTNFQAETKTVRRGEWLLHPKPISDRRKTCKARFIANVAGFLRYMTYTPYENCLFISTWNMRDLRSWFVALKATWHVAKSLQTHNALSGKSAVIGTGLPSWVGKGLAA